MNLFGKMFGNKPSLDSVTFDHADYQYQGERNGAKIWFLAGGGGVGLYFFQQTPGLPANAASALDLQNFYSSQLSAKQRLVEFRLEPFDGVRGIRVVTAEINPQTRAAVCLGSLTIPFEKFSYVVKVQCEEAGLTGAREAVVTDWALKNGKATIGEGRLRLQGVSSDDEQFDQMAPAHPLSRVRKELRRISGTLKIDPSIKSQPHFPLP